MTERSPGSPGPQEISSQVEVHSIDHILESERHGTLRSLGSVWFVSNLNLTAMATGVVIVSLGGSLFWAIVATVLGCLFGTVFMALHSTQGPHLGLPQLVQSRAQFGYAGAAITVFIVVFINYVAYNTSDALLSSDAARTLVSLPLWLGYLGAAAIAAAISIFGYDMIHRVNRVLVIPITLIMLLLTVGMFELGGISSDTFAVGRFDLPTFMTIFVITGGFQLGWAPYVSDYSRYLPSSTSSRALFWMTYLPSGLSAIWVFVVGAIAQTGSGAETPVGAFKAAGDALFQGAGTIVVVGLLVGLLAVMAVNQYGGSLTLLSIVDSIRPIRSTRAKRVVAILLMAILVWGIAHLVGEERFNTFYSNVLIYLAYLFTPWTAINLTDYFLVRRGAYRVADLHDPSGGIYGRWGIRGNSVYLITLAAMTPFMVTSNYVGFLAKQLDEVDYSLFVGLAVGVGLYLLSLKFFPLADEPAGEAGDLSKEAVPVAGGEAG